MLAVPFVAPVRTALHPGRQPVHHFHIASIAVVPYKRRTVRAGTWVWRLLAFAAWQPENSTLADGLLDRSAARQGRARCVPDRTANQGDSRSHLTFITGSGFARL
jgi:hypothetical protein